MAVKKQKRTQTKPLVCMPTSSPKYWLHTTLAGVIILFLLFSESGYWWAYWVVLVAALVIFFSGVVECCRNCKI